MSKTLIIAEAGVNHNGDMALAKKLIDVASEAGADIVKFQTFKAEKLVSKSAKKADYQKTNLPDSDDNQFLMLKKLELDLPSHELLMKHCKTRNIQFLSTPFDIESVHLLDSLGIGIFKIPSGEITNKPLLESIAAYNKQVILSTGMANLGEIEAALTVLTRAGTDQENITVLHCNTEYPTPFEDVNLKAMNTIAQAFGVQVGYSDHTLGIEVPIAAVARGAQVIEKHFTLDRNLEGPDHRASLEPQELKAMVNAIRNIDKALGSAVKAPSPSEQKNKEIARKSIHVAKPLPEGHVLTAQDLVMKRPAKGISPMEITQVIGKSINKTLSEDHLLTYADLI